MASEPVVCTEDPAQGSARVEDFRALLGKAESVERPTPQHLRVTLATSEGLDIGVLAREMQCCGWFEFTLAPTREGTAVLDVRVPANAGPVRGAASEQQGVGNPEEILDEFARTAGDADGGSLEKGG